MKNKIYLMTIFCLLTGYCSNMLKAQTGPGGVAGASLWLKADTGINSLEYFKVPGASRTASTTYPVSYLAPSYSTIDSPNSWSSNTIDTNQYLTLDLGSIQPAYGVITQGRKDFDQWTKTYKISYSNDNVNYTDLSTTFSANTDRSTKVVNIFPSVITARYIRIKVTDYYDRPSMRADVIKKLNTVSAENSMATVWLDQSGSNNHMIQADSIKRPIYLNTTSAVNFNPVLSFNGSNNELTDINGIFGTSTNNNAAAFVVSSVKTVQNSSIFFEIVKNQSNTDTQFNLHAPWGDNKMYWDSGPNRIETAWGGDVNTPYIWTGWNNASLSPNKTSLRRNGTEIISGTTMNSYSGQNKPMYIGSTGGGSFYNGKMGEVIIFPTALSAQDRIRVESYLAFKYGITLSRDSDNDNTPGEEVGTGSGIFEGD
ncbi:MAG: discoidin domain-containing protein, partial [Chryseobacterium sp.]